jgi:hypothetical protein
MRNNYQEAIAAHCLTPFGREELRAQQAGYHTIHSGLQLPTRRPVHASLSSTQFELTVIQSIDAISNRPCTVGPRSSGHRREEGGDGRHFPVGRISRSRDEDEDDEIHGEDLERDGGE